MMTQINHKLEQAINKLADIFEEKIPFGRIAQLVEKGQLSDSEIYNTLEKYGYFWRNNKWELHQPKWLQQASKRFASDYRGTAFSELAIWNPPTPNFDFSISLFHDYLWTMESFVEIEVQKRASELKEFEENPLSNMVKKAHHNQLDDMEIYHELQIRERDLQLVEDFVYVLRQSFFVNLWAFVENYLKDICPDQKFGRNVIESAFKHLVGPLVNQIPEWKEVLPLGYIRNCIIHCDAIVDKSKRSKEIRQYCNNKDFLQISEQDKLIFEKGFCENTLETVERFLLKTHLINSERNRTIRKP